MIHTSGITTYEYVKYLADTIGARPSGSKQASDTIKYVCENFEDYGFELYKDTFKPLVYAHKRSYVEIQNSKKTQIKAIPLMFSGTTNNNGICREIVYVRGASFFQMI